MKCRLLRGAKADPQAEIAVHQAEEALEKAKARGGEVSRIASSLRLIRERNHLTEKLNPIMEGKFDGNTGIS